MTKTISLADDAYKMLAGAKRPGESFSDVARRLARLDRQRELFDREVRADLSDEEAEAWKAEIRAERDRSDEPRVEFS